MLRHSRFIVPVALVLLFVFQAGLAQKKKLTYEQAFEYGEPRLTSFPSRPMGWLDDTYYLEMKREQGGGSIVKVHAVTGEETVFFNYADFKDDLPEGFNLARSEANTDDYQKHIFSQENDLYYFNATSKEFKRLSENEPEENNPTFSPDGKKVAFTRDHDLYVIDLESGKETRLTTDGDELVYNGWASWVYYEEILGRASRYSAFWWAPNSEMIAYLRFDDSPVPMFPIYRSEGQHGELEKTRYPKSGDPNPLVKLGVVNLADAKTLWLDDTEADDHYVAWPFWSPDSKILVYQHLNRGQDDMRFMAGNPNTGESKEIYHEQNKTWVDFFTDIYVLGDGTGFLVRSDRSGWRNLYHYDFEGNLVNQVTNFGWRIEGIEQVVEKTKTVFFTGTGGESTESHLYSIKLDGKGLKKLTTIPGSHSASVSPGGKYFTDSYSNLTTPTKVEIFDTKGKSIRLVADTKAPEMDEYDLGKVELFRVKIDDGYELPVTLILPPGFDENKKYPVIISIYGGPDAGFIANRFPWGMSQFWYAQQGIIMVSMDHRASGHFGKKGLDEMHRNLGKWEMHDYIEVVKWLEEKPFINGDKIGITGGSYGGYTTCMALTYGADYFNYGIANYSGTDWQLYDNVYTERFMDTPLENPEGYEFGSVMTHAGNYKGYLLITHGTMDDNVHLQNSIQLVSKLQDLGKDFEMMFYPGVRHGWGGPKGQHLRQLQLKFWFRHLLDTEFVKE
ncbi:MAG: S9 family peptidase [Bacteroidales bacterium]|nr:S9 family peptidase [Bacteroidales bacterium]